MEACKYTNKLRTWPLDWETHIVQGFELYFQKRDSSSTQHVLTDMSFVSFSCPLVENESTEIRILLESMDCFYVAWVLRGEPSTKDILINVFKCVDLVHDIKEAETIRNNSNRELSIFTIGHSIAVGESICLFSNSTPYEAIKTVESLISDDLWRDSGGFDNDDPGPEYPFVPGGNLLLV